MINNILMSLLLQHGKTASVEGLQSYYKIGCGLDSESTTISHVETAKNKKQTIVDNCFCYAWQYAFTPDKAYVVRYVDEILCVLCNIVHTVKTFNERTHSDTKFIIWCANLAHEWSFLKKYICETFLITKCFAKTQRDVLLIQLEKCVEFRECIGLFGNSLDDISKKYCSANNRKLTGTFDYDKIRTCETELTETELQYMEHDVTALAEMHMKIIAELSDENGAVKIPRTSAGFIRFELKNSILHDDDLTELREIYNGTHNKKPLKTNLDYLKRVNSKTLTDSLQWYICREYGYSGGLCGTNLKLAGKILNNVKCADLTSDYPAQLLQRSFPSGELREVKAYNLNVERKHLHQKHVPYFALLLISKIDSKTHIATFSEHKIINKDNEHFINTFGKAENVLAYNGKIHHAENILVCVNDVDIEAYKKIYNIKANVIKLWKFDGYKPLPKYFIEPLIKRYIEKAKLKSQGIKSGKDYNNAKRFVNSIYGVCATRASETCDTLDDDFNFTSSKDLNFKQMKNNMYLNPYIAFWCTSYARSILMHFLSNYPDSIVQYDTDSLYYLEKDRKLENELIQYNKDIEYKNKVTFEYLDRCMFAIPDDERALLQDLGTWDFDEKYAKFLGLGAKKYIKQGQDGKISTVIAGLPKTAIPKEIITRGINEPFNYYNPVVKWLQENDKTIIIEHLFSNKFASVYGDDLREKVTAITDYTGKTSKQLESTYHAIIPIDFTLSMQIDYIKKIIGYRN